MKGEKGITLLTLVVYVIIITFVVAAVTTISTSFYENLKQFDDNTENAVSFSKFSMYFLRDIKKENVRIVGKESNYIILSYNDENIEYSVQNNALYKNKIKICDDVQDALFTVNNNKITVYLKIGDYEKTTTYVMETI